MRDIGTEEAAASHGVTARHQQMDNGELRFRLVKDDGTAYIRTEAGPLGAWQNSHYHRRTMETYIVQKGWIAYVELRDGRRSVSIRNAGELFTTRPGVIHNVYMPADAVIHTVKHGESTADDRIVDDATRAFDRETHALSERQIQLEAE